MFGRHGLLPEEAVLGQRFYLSLEARLDLEPAGGSRRRRRHGELRGPDQVTVDIATGRRFNLIEALAESIASAILRGSPWSRKSPFRIDKPSAPVPAILDGVSVEITRRREDRP